ncbi:UNVERIFIED_ORG: integrase [Methylobacterium sp. SuP10 SLI 274]|uniref:tyrosine-type recombinase/integrase n=1 Tax=Methylorubrum TaxID=2282523 RepID=UPI0014780270|nr:MULTISPECIES: tyrosine-type recombinase/integrase [Methylorubrum]MDF9865497.1 integrase [Methylorubrum pseudosasae]MDH6639066.1 integrase [Methylobacterium sp. SuP10 SLI 274]MDH6668256.1 integrase [Methylorubrum zatmanii]MCP1560142.1 integrase [Methylorubrum extorquens]MDF9793799.1 integrase [Methylorubrum extorquens]
MNAPLKGPPKRHIPIVVPAPRETHPGDYYGKEVFLDRPIWQLNDFAHPELRLDWASLEFSHRGMVEATADFIVDLLSTSASNVANHFNAIARLKTLRAFRLWSHPVISLNRADLNQSFFYEARDVAKFTRGELSHLQRWYRFCAKREGSGVNRTSASIVDAISIGGGPKAVAVLTRDPKGGPLDDAETTALLQALAAAREAGAVPIQGLVAVWLCIVLGPNPRMLSMMREEDFRRVDGRHPELSVPRIKGKDAFGRTQFKTRKLDEPSATLVEELIAANAAARKAHPWDDDRYGKALFPRTKPDARLVGRPQHAYAMHRSSALISRLVMRTVVALGVRSPRTGETLKAGPRRFRYTFATRLLREGASAEVVKDLLDHKDLQTIRAYLNLRGELVEKLDAAMAMELAPMAQAFLGMLVGSEAEAVRGDTRASRIFGAGPSKEEGLGTCGSLSFCGLAAPVACYTCIRFQPWVEGPHTQVLDGLLRQREERRERGLDGRLVTMTDNTILAVADVVRLCEDAKRARDAADPEAAR